MTATRTLPRQRRRLEVSFGGRLPAVTADVSMGGFCAEMPGVFLPGSIVHGLVKMGDRVFPFAGEVAWARAGNPQASLHSQFGVRFTHVAKDLLHQLRDEPRSRVKRPKVRAPR